MTETNEGRWIRDVENACPCCGGSGHKDDASTPVAALLPAAVAHANKAMRKHPQPNYVISKWAEETGEVTKALIHLAEGRYEIAGLRGEIIQSLAMLHRLMVEGDQVHGLPPIAAMIERAG